MMKKQMLMYLMLASKTKKFHVSFSYDDDLCEKHKNSMLMSL